MNYFGHWFFRQIAFPVISFLLKSQSAVQEVHLRGSTQNPKAFNLFMSDLDLTVILSSLTASEIARLKSKLKIIKKIFPWLGEVEIYSKEEDRKLTELKSTYGEIYQSLRDFRKTAWMEVEYSKRKSKYHRAKALRAIRNIFSKYEIKEKVQESQNQIYLKPLLNSLLDKHLGNLTTDLNTQDIYCAYYGTTAMDPRALAIAPGFWDTREEIQKQFDEFRTLPQYGKLWNGLSQMELLIFEGAMRGRNTQEGWMSDWKEALVESVRQASH